MKMMALDHGRARTGVAVSDPEGVIARPLPAIANVGSPDGQAALDALIAAEAPERIIVGDPILMSGESGAQSRAARSFAGRLRSRVAPPVELYDERLTTAEARRRRAESGSASDLDSLAACILLEAAMAAGRS
jgi:putative Holliday junction resolvase